MFETSDNDGRSILALVIRVVYLTLASIVAIGALLIGLFPGTTREEIRERGIYGYGGMTLLASMALMAILIPYVPWKLFIERKLPETFWGIAFLVAATPFILMFVFGILFR